KSKDTFVLLSKNYSKGDFYKHFSQTQYALYSMPKNCVMFDSWKKIILQLRKLYDKANVVIFPSSPIQLPDIVS
ncbi:MAG: hypothetical protein ACFFD2_20650, partial [Promethearchaeota archaeon]